MENVIANQLSLCDVIVVQKGSCEEKKLSNFYLRRPDWHHVPSLGSNHKKLLTSSSLALANNGVARGEAATNTNQRCCS